MNWNRNLNFYGSLTLILVLFFSFIYTSAITGQSYEPYRVSIKKEMAIFGTTASMLGINYWLEKRNSALSIDQISMLSKGKINLLDRSAIGNYSHRADIASDVFLIANSLAPLTLLFSKNLDKSKSDYLLMFGETFALNGAVTLLVKSSINRTRPYAYNATVPLGKKLEKDAKKSFFSGHTSQSASLAFFSAKVFADLYPDSKYKKLVWTGAIVLPAATAYFRYKAGQHFPTDVLTGYAVGAIIGYIIPMIHKTSSRNNVQIYGSSNGLAAQWNF